jgi:hypothetical protein
MPDSPNVARSLRDRLSDSTEDRLGKALSELLENPLLTAAIGRAFDAREKASQAQELAMGALNIPSAADIERLTRRLRSISHRLEGIEEGVHQMSRALNPAAVEARLTAIEEQLATLNTRLQDAAAPAGAAPASAPPTSGTPRSSARRASGARRAGAQKQPRPPEA